MKKAMGIMDVRLKVYDLHIQKMRKELEGIELATSKRVHCRSGSEML